MSKITLSTVGSLTQNPTSAQTTINANFATLQTAYDDTLSRDGTSPNQMENDLDMNSNQIINLPAPATANSPLRLQDLDSFVGGGTVTNIPSGGTSGQVLAKNSNNNYDVLWETVSTLPSGGTTGQVLEKNSNTNFDVSWQTPSSAVSTSACGPIYYVTTNGNDSNDGRLPYLPKLTIQAAINAGGGNSTIVVAPGTYTLTSSLVMRPGISIVGNGVVIITQGNGANISPLVDFSTNTANGASIYGCIVDGNRANNTDNVNATLVYIGGASDVTIDRCTIQNSNGYGIDVSTGLRPRITRNYLTNIYAIAISCITGTGQYPTYGKILNNTIATPFGQHGISSVNSDYNEIAGNDIRASGIGAPMTINTSGFTVTWVSGANFANVSPGMFLVTNGAQEFLITAKASNTSLTVNTSPGTLTGAVAYIGEGDIISIDSSSMNLVHDNKVYGGATGSIVLSNFTGGASAARNKIYNNNLQFCGETAISVQSLSNGTQVFDGVISGNTIEDPNQNQQAGTVFATGINFVGAQIANMFVDGNYVRDDQGTPTTQYWMGLSGVVAGQIRVGSNSSAGTVNPGIYGGISSVSLSGWGSGASVSNIVSYGDACEFTVTAGSSPSANPSFTANTCACPAAATPLYVSKYASGSGALAPVFGEQNSTNAACVGFYNGTPANTNTYTFICRA